MLPQHPDCMGAQCTSTPLLLQASRCCTPSPFWGASWIIHVRDLFILKVSRMTDSPYPAKARANLEWGRQWQQPCCYRKSESTATPHTPIKPHLSTIQVESKPWSPESKFEIRHVDKLHCLCNAQSNYFNPLLHLLRYPWCWGLCKLQWGNGSCVKELAVQGALRCAMMAPALWDSEFPLHGLQSQGSEVNLAGHLSENGGEWTGMLQAQGLP